MANTIFSIDVTVAANDGTITGGYTQVASVAMNAAGPGWTSVASENPINFYWWAGSGQRTQTLTINYTAFRDAITSTGYIEIIFTLNTGGGAPPEMYFDNAKLTGALKPYNEEVMADNPVLYLRFEANTDVNTSSGNGVQADSSGNNYWAVHRAATEFREKAGIDNCRFLRNDPQNAIAAANRTADPGWSNSFGDQYAFAKGKASFEFWMKSAAMDSYGLFFQQVKTDQKRAPGMGNSAGSIRILTGVYNSDPNAQSWWYTGVPTPLDDQWHHMVVSYEERYNGDPNAMQIQFYLDGALAGSTITADTDGKGLGPELDHIVLGGLNDKGYTYDGNRYYGYIDEFAIYAGILSRERVATHYATGMVALTPRDCADVWQRGQGLTGDINRDCAVNLTDFAILARSWLGCNDPVLFGTDPTCMPTW